MNRIILQNLPKNVLPTSDIPKIYMGEWVVNLIPLTSPNILKTFGSSSTEKVCVDMELHLIREGGGGIENMVPIPHWLRQSSVEYRQ